MKRFEMFSSLPLQNKLLIYLSLLIVLVLGSCLGLFLSDLRTHYLISMELRSEALAQNLIYQIQNLLLPYYNEPMQQGLLRGRSVQCQALYALNHEKGITHIAIIAPDGTILAHNDKRLWNTVVSTPIIRAQLGLSDTQTVLAKDIYHTLVPIFDPEKQYLGTVDIGFPKAVIDLEMQSLWYRAGGLFGGFLLLGIGFSYLFSRNLVKALSELARGSELLADGDLTHEINLRGSQEIQQLSRTFQYMATRLRTLADQVAHAGGLLRASTHEIFQVADQLASSLEQQAASVLETSITMDNVVTASKQIAQNAESVVEIAQKTRTDAHKGLEVAEDTIKKMHEIEDTNQANAEDIQMLGQKSEEIAKIMDVIAAIADRTKLIAFNASLEAAGAGSTGARFEVVAREIRHLADTVIAATGAIRQTLIDMQQGIHQSIQSSEISTKTIQEGAAYTTHTANWLKEIVTGAVDTTEAAQQISQSTQQQQLASEEISGALKELSSNINYLVENGALTRNIADTLDALAQNLERRISRFKLS